MSQNPTTLQPTSLSEVKNYNKVLTRGRWQRRWDIAETGRWTHDLIPKVQYGKISSIGSREAEVKLNRLRLGQTKLRKDLHRILPEICDSPLCPCGETPETTDHYLLYCTNHDTSRLHMCSNIYIAYARDDIPTYERDFSIHTLLGTNQGRFTKDVRKSINSSIVQFIEATEVSI